MPYSHLLVPSDGSERSLRAVREAARLAAALGARITVLTVEQQPRMPVPGMGERLDAATMATGAETGAITTGLLTALTMRTVPSASVISNSDTLDSETKSMRVLSFLKSIIKSHP